MLARNRNWLVALFSIAPAIGACSSDDPEFCTAADVERELMNAQSGQIVQLGACRIEGSFTVPSGVTVRGRGETATTIVPAAGGVAFQLQPGGELPSCVKDLKIELDARAGIEASGAGSACLENVTVHATRGNGFVGRDLTSVSITNVEISGPVNAGNAMSLPDIVTTSISAPHGVALLRVANATIDDANLSGFAVSAAYFSDSTVSWTRGNASNNFRVGVFVSGGTATLEDLETSGTFSGFGLRPAYGLACDNAGAIITRRLKANGNDGPGLFQNDCMGAHTDLLAEDNQYTGAWVQFVPSIEISGSLRRNKRAGLVTVETMRVRVSDAMIGGTIATMSQMHGEPPIEVGDGLHLVDSANDLAVTNVSFDGNERTGILLDLGGAAADAAQFNGVTVNGAGMSLGAIAQDGTVPMGWDAGIQRAGATAANDMAFSGTLPTVGIVGPCDYPRGDR